MTGKKGVGGWKGKSQPHYKLRPASYGVTAVTIFGEDEFIPSELVKRAWKFVKANSEMVLKKTE